MESEALYHLQTPFVPFVISGILEKRILLCQNNDLQHFTGNKYIRNVNASMLSLCTDRESSLSFFPKH